MTKKIPEPGRRSLLLDLLKGATDFLEEITDALTIPSEEDRRLAKVEAEVSAAQEDVEAVKAEIDGLQTAVEAVEKRQVTDTQTILETLEKLQQTQDLILERVKTLEEAGRVEEAARWKALLQRVAKLILLLVGPVALAEALRDAFVQEELYPWLKRLRQQAKGVLDASESSPSVATPTVEPTPAEPSSSEPGTSWSETLYFDWVTIPAGWFWMGSDKARDKHASDDETPYHQVYLPAFRIARVPVTVAQYESFVRATGHKNVEFKPTVKLGRKSNHPVNWVSWHDAQAFCSWAKVRLPTEAEWEKAARGTDGRIWPWGNYPPEPGLGNYSPEPGLGNYRRKGELRDTTPVGSYPAGKSPYGVLDMAGNVLEWTNSHYKSYPYDPDDGREDGAETGSFRVLRGGSFADYYGSGLRCAARGSGNPLYGVLDFIGFRVCASSRPLASVPL